MKKAFFWYLILSVVAISLAPRADAAFVTSISVDQKTKDLSNIRRVLEEKLMCQRLLDLGFTTQQVDERVSALSDDQIHSLAMRLQQVRVGGVGEGVLLGILIIILVIFVALPLAGIRVWFDGKA